MVSTVEPDRSQHDGGGWYAALRSLVRHYQWVHIALGILGNLAFLVGSVFFLYEGLKRVGIWLFVVGAAGMLVASVGNAVVAHERDGD